MTQEELNKILDHHKKWLLDEIDGIRANLSNADLSGANLRYANLSNANLSNADLSGANLSYANLSGANLSYADLSGANLSNADLSYCIYQLSRIGSANRLTTFNASADVVFCGCFKGTFAEWSDKIRVGYSDKTNRYRRQYEAALTYFATLAEIDGMPQYKEYLEGKNANAKRD